MACSSPVLSVATAAHCFDVQFHPTEPLLSAATITGDVELHRFDPIAGTSEQVRTVKCHTESCRAVGFLAAVSEGNSHKSAARLASVSADGFAVVSDIESCERIWRSKLQAAGNALLTLDSNRFVTGDDDGNIILFDVRQAKQKKTARRYSDNSDFISDMAVGSDQFSLCVTSGDGTFAVYDLRKTGEKGLIAMSDFQEDEFLSLCIVRQGTKVICGSQSGTLAIFSWGDFGDQKDRIPGHPMSVDAMVRLAEDGVLTGSSDGKIRAVAVHSRKHGNAIVGTFAEHGTYPVERLALSPDGNLVASASHGQPAIRLWSADVGRTLLSDESTGKDAGVAKVDDEVDSSDEDEPKKKRRKKKRKGVAAEQDRTREAGTFFSGL